MMSVHSSGSDKSVPVRLSTSDITHQHSTTRRRPRYGVEYQRIERRQGSAGYDVVDDCSTSSSTPQASPYSISSSSVFTFDTCDDDQPPPPPLPVRTRRPHPTYINLSPHPRSTSDSSTQVELNYAEIDLTGLTDGRCRPRNRDDAEPTPYAVIDLEATAAAAQTGREHARLREGLLQNKSIRRPGVTTPKSATLGRYSRPCAHRKSSMPSSLRETSLFDMTRWPSLLPDDNVDNR